jgi:hypothetical protein
MKSDKQIYVLSVRTIRSHMMKISFNKIISKIHEEIFADR